MYQVASSSTLVAARRRLFTGVVGRTVVLLGVTSLLTDISSEMVATVLPLYLVYGLGFSPLAFGVVDGIHQGAAAVLRLAGGFFADRLGRHKEVAAVGYGLSAVCKLALVLVGGAWGAIAAVVFADRMGKGIRTGPRDAMISLSTRREDLGTAFGVHRAMDTTGAMLGPLVAFAILAAAPLAFDTVFVVSFSFALVGVGVLVLLVDSPVRAPAAAVEPEESVSLRAALSVVVAPRFRVLAVAGSLLAVATVSDAFVYMILQRRDGFETSLFPLLFVGTAIVYMLLAAPLGRLADRVGRARVFLGGYAFLLGVYCLLLGPSLGAAGAFIALALLGIHYAATDGVLMALGSAVVPEELRATGLAGLATVTSLARLLASVVFGAAWVLLGIENAVAAFAVALVVALIAAVAALRRLDA